MSEQLAYSDPFREQRFAENPEPRCPCVLLLDISGSMAGAPIQALNDGLKTFQSDLVGDSIAAKRVEIAIVTFGGGVETRCPFTTAEAFQAPFLSPEGDTPMGEAIELALSLVEQEKQKYKSNGIAYYRPWVFLITDGRPTDGERWKSAASLVKEQESRGGLAFFAVGVLGADMETLKSISVRPPVSLAGLNFRELFLWLSASQKGVSQSTPGEKVKLPDMSGWAEV